MDPVQTHDSLNQIFSYLDFPSLLICRTVCQAWNANAKLILEQHTLNQIRKKPLNMSKKSCDFDTIYRVSVRPFRSSLDAEIIFSNTLIRKKEPKAKYLPLVRYLEKAYFDRGIITLTRDLHTTYEKTAVQVKDFLMQGVVLPPVYRDRVERYITDDVLNLLRHNKCFLEVTKDGNYILKTKKKICEFTLAKRVDVTCTDLSIQAICLVNFFKKLFITLGKDQFEKRIEETLKNPLGAKEILFPE